MHRILLHVLTLVLIAGGATAPAAEIEVAPGHPRIYLRPGDEEALRQRVATRPAIAAFYDQLKSRIDSTRNRHNTLRVGGDQIRYGSNQVQYVQPMREMPLERGKITEFLSADDYDYAAADFGNAYH